MSEMVTIRVDHENNAQTWWDAARAVGAAVDCPMMCRHLVFCAIGSGDRATVSAEDAEAFKAWASTLPGWNDGPAHAPHPFTFN